MPSIACFVSAPVVSFRNPRAREYLESLPVAPPSTVYGMLCSAVGEPNRLVHQGAELAIGVSTNGARSRVLRTSWRMKSLRNSPGLEDNSRPDFQELLTKLRLIVHVRNGLLEAAPSLAERLHEAFQNPASVSRFGGLSLGESTHLVDELGVLKADHVHDSASITWLVQDESGRLALPTWPDHVGSHRTRHIQFTLVEATDPFSPPDKAWVTINPLPE